jgi:mono/diheme cytochrome c family protein
MMLRSCWTLAAGALLGLGTARAESSRPTAEQADLFERRVRPVLVESCVSCHGPKKQMGGLRLDSREALLQGGDGGPVIRPGDPENSPLVQAVRRGGELKMPPKKALPPDAVADLAAWVRAGAPWPAAREGSAGADEAWRRHWAFVPVKKAPPPAVRNEAWVSTAVDRFILARLEKEGLTPSPAADRRTLIRRVTFDLIGLPPTPEEVDDFLGDSSPDAYEKLVDRLLASPHYGERWARHWLDVARYADTKGYVFFEEKEFPWAYTYRDYVIRAFNEDLPYDRFIVEQLAADQLPPGEDKRALTAMGFLSLGGRFMNNVQDILDDRIDVVTRGLLGLTVSCARCHDHKFDPIPSKDYYSLYGVFASSVEPAVPPLFAEPPKTAQYEAFQKELQKREQKLAEFVRTKRAEVIGGARTRAADYLLAAHAMRGQPATDEFMLIADGSDLNPAMLTRWRAFLARTRKTADPIFTPWHLFAELPEMDFASRAKEVCARLASGQAGGSRVNPLVAAAFADKPPANMNEVARRYGELLNATEKLWQAALERAAQNGQAPPTALSEPAREELRRIFHGPGAPPDVPPGVFSDLQLLPDRPSQGKLQELLKAVEQWRASGPGAPPRAMVLVDASTPYDPCVFLRGNPNNRGEPVPRQFLGLLAGPQRRPFTRGSGRLELARAITDPNNPLTARVLVNRVWLNHFGRGLVSTPSDFGMRSDPPSHPELLDWLAATFVEQGWSIKKLHRLIVLSSAYRQRSDDRADCRRRDAENVLLWRMNRQRLDFEAMRDTLLAVSGRLDPAIGGKPVRDLLSPASRRRTVYGFIDRLQVPGLYRAFDFPSPDASSPQRDRTTIPQQALFLMNNPFVLESARALVQRPEVAGEKDRGRRVGRLYRLLYGRAPTAEEVSLAQEFVGPTDDGTAWARYAQGLLLANEFAFID